ncbi:MAG TPA: RNHCP domain-containing protein [Candidatus Paceibacterota bacterium]
MSLKFQRKKENFVCEHCGIAVEGSGFTNHCPACLFSKHVDVYPGDRGGECLGLMEPKALLLERGEYQILHRCIRCGAEKKNRAAPGDALQTLLDS